MGKDFQSLFFGDRTSRQQEIRMVDDGRIADCIYHERLDEDHVAIEEKTKVINEVWPIIDCGWPDTIGVFRNSVIVKTEILMCAPCETISGSMNHVPIRGKMRICLGQ